MKLCKQCSQTLKPSSFYARSAICKGCIRDNNYVKNYGITHEDYLALVEIQNGRCAICNGFPHGSKGNKLHVDHDHKTGKVRQLLCSGCNTALGLVNEDLATLLSMMAYIQRHSKQLLI